MKSLSKQSRATWLENLYIFKKATAIWNYDDLHPLTINMQDESTWDQVSDFGPENVSLTIKNNGYPLQKLIKWLRETDPQPKIKRLETTNLSLQEQ